MSDNIQTNTTGRLTPCLQQKIDKTRYLVEIHFSDTSTQSVEDKLKRVILHDLEHGKQGKSRKCDKNIVWLSVLYSRPDTDTAVLSPANTNAPASQYQKESAPWESIYASHSLRSRASVLFFFLQAKVFCQNRQHFFSCVGIKIRADI